MALDRRLVYHFDWTLFVMTLGLAGLGLLSVLSASWGGPKHTLDPLVVRQLIWIGVGTALMATAAFFDYRALATYAYPLYAITVVLLAAVMVSGHVTGGSRRWLNLGVLRLEPSELAKLALVLVMVRYLREEPPRGGWSFRQMIIPALLLGIPLALVLKQPDLGTGIVLILVTATLVFAGGLNGRVLLVAALAAALAAPAGWHYLKPYQKQRLVSFPQSAVRSARRRLPYHPVRDRDRRGRRVGQGLSERHSGAAEFSARADHRLYLCGFRRGVRLRRFDRAARPVLGTDRARRMDRASRPRSLRQLLAIGFTGIVFWQVAINIGMATGMLPVVGITLPLVSYGGSSLIAMMAAMGVMISINTRRYLF